MTLRYIAGMLRTVIFDRKAGKGRYRDIVRVAERLSGSDEYSSATRAVAQMVRRTQEFKDEWAKIEAEDREKAEAKRRSRKRGAA